MILEKTVELVKQIYRYHKILPPKINKIIIGHTYSGVEIATYAYGMILGVAYTLRDIFKNQEEDLEGIVEDFKEKEQFRDVLKWSYETSNLKRIIGIAALNAASQHLMTITNPHKKIKTDLLDYLRIERHSKVICIGLIKPLIQKISRITSSITIVENKRIPKISPFNKFSIKTNITQLKENELPTDILICTGATLINDSLEEILTYFKRNARKIVVIGPSASIIPDILFDWGVDVVGGFKITDTEAVIKVIQEGGGTKRFKQFGKKYNLIKEEHII